ncbi:dynein regulatory complex subunit 3-like [Drosophila tropicalis]|uniref:dynein regulatory complex subunit 3-like n=1 Tax=Drosophila tropicalis TaxID=46794 RepID=UPI0035AB9E3C
MQLLIIHSIILFNEYLHGWRSFIRLAMSYAFYGAPRVHLETNHRGTHWLTCTLVSHHQEYLTTLQQRPKWTTTAPNISVGDVVLVKESNTPPAHWHLALILEAYPGKDQLVRAVRLKTSSGELTRPITKVAVLPRSETVRELREIGDKQEKEIQTREILKREQSQASRLASSFVEHLDGHQLYASLWRCDDDGRILMLVGSQAQDLAEEYDKDIFEITQEIYKLGMDRFAEREKEIQDFLENLYNGQEELQAMGQKEIEDFLQFKDRIFEDARLTHRQLEQNIMHGEDDDSPENLKLSDIIDKLNIQFEDYMNDMWQTLMLQELHLHEAIEESTTNFHRRLSELMSKFVEQTQAFFVQLREIAGHFSENMTEIVTRFISTKLALQDFEDVPIELKVFMDDRDAILNLIAGMKDSHTLRIDEREDRMATRSKEFIDHMIDNLYIYRLDVAAASPRRRERTTSRQMTLRCNRR